ncbi:hypothetical protein [Streptomyces abyssomicinicus]|uniref:hypothetical protein n=1 Tax=Streptomyces abyssomicinicus TaxID=574929 RepID=UPI003F76783E
MRAGSRDPDGAAARRLAPAGLRDTGAYCFTGSWGDNSLPRPAVHGYRAGGGGRVVLATVREARPVEEIVRENGLGHADALLDGFGGTAG